MKKIIFLLLMTTSIGIAKTNSEYILLDVRTAHEFSNKHLENARNLDFLDPQFEQQISRLDKAKEYKLYCRSGNRSGKALKLMQEKGFKRIENLGSLEEAQDKLNLKCEGSC